jgi:hypothetical protein
MAAAFQLEYQPDLRPAWRRKIGHSAWPLLAFPLRFSEHSQFTPNQFLRSPWMNISNRPMSRSIGSEHFSSMW